MGRSWLGEAPSGRVLSPAPACFLEAGATGWEGKEALAVDGAGLRLLRFSGYSCELAGNGSRGRGRPPVTSLDIREASGEA